LSGGPVSICCGGHAVGVALKAAGGAIGNAARGGANGKPCVVYQVAIAFQVLQVQQVQAVEGSFEW
jgi:hypothetical protein